jgi:5-methylcytosine-specific restriction enzyme A
LNLAFTRLGEVSVNDNWSIEELRSAVEAYVEMQRKVNTGQALVKKRYYTKLAATFGRTEKAFEFRMQNISYVLSLMGRDWLPGLMPAKNVGAKVAAEIERLIAQAENRAFLPIVEFEILVRTAVKKKNIAKQNGNRFPKIVSVGVTQFQRDSTVKAWVLQQAAGKCENCQQPAPFNSIDGSPFLEIHHVRKLADNGSDTVANAVALCPNCHREFHYGEHSQALVARLYELVTRLVRE